MKKVVIFLLLISVIPSAQACLLTELFHILTCNYFRYVQSDQELLCDIWHRVCYERGLTALLSPVCDFLVQQKRQYPTIRLAVVFDIDGTVFYPKSKVRKEAVYKFYCSLNAADFCIIFISACPLSDLVLIEGDLRRAGYTNWVDLVLMPDDFIKQLEELPNKLDRAAGVSAWKAYARSLVERKFSIRIAATFDDVPLNLTGDSCGMPVWIPGYSQLRESYKSLREQHDEFFKQHIVTSMGWLLPF